MESNPRLADDVELTPLGGPRGDAAAGVRGASTFVILRPVEQQLLTLIDGTRTTDEMRQRMLDECAVAISAESVEAFLLRLRERGLLSSRTASRTPEMNPGHWTMRFALFDPDRLLGVIASRLSWLFRWETLAVSAVSCFVVTLAVANQADTLKSEARTILQGGGWPLLAVLVIAVTATHELAHGTACKHYGGSVRELGVVLVLGVLPGLYCNLSDVYRLPRRSRRLMVIGAGVYWQAMVTTAAGTVWLLSTPQSWLHSAAALGILAGALNLMFNCNPLLPLDGYYALCALLGEPNLAARASKFMWESAGWLVSGRSTNMPVRWRLYATYWIAASVFAWLMAAATAAFAGKHLMNHFGLAGALVLMAAVAAWLATRARNSWRWLRQEPRTARARLAGIAVAILLFPLRGSVGAPCVVRPGSDDTVIRSPRSACIVAVDVRAGERVRKGARIALLADDALGSEVAERRAAVARAEAEARAVDQRLSDTMRARDSAEERRRERTERALDLRREADAASMSATAQEPPSVALAEAELAIALLRVKELERRTERIVRLSNEGLIGAQEMESVRAEWMVAQDVARRARSGVMEAKTRHRREIAKASSEARVFGSEIRWYASAVTQIRAERDARHREVAQLRSLLDHAERRNAALTLRAPDDGVVLAAIESHDAGRRVDDGEVICRIAAAAPAIVEIAVPARSRDRVRPGAPVRFKVQEISTRVFRGEISRIQPLPLRQGAAGIVLAYARITSGAHGLTPEMTGFARIDDTRRPIGWLIVCELWRLLRPEVWFL